MMPCCAPPPRLTRRRHTNTSRIGEGTESPTAWEGHQGPGEHTRTQPESLQSVAKPRKLRNPAKIQPYPRSPPGSIVVTLCARQAAVALTRCSRPTQSIKQARLKMLGRMLARARTQDRHPLKYYKLGHTPLQRAPTDAMLHSFSAEAPSQRAQPRKAKRPRRTAEPLPNSEHRTNREVPPTSPSEQGLCADGPLLNTEPLEECPLQKHHGAAADRKAERPRAESQSKSWNNTPLDPEVAKAPDRQMFATKSSERLARPIRPKEHLSKRTSIPDRGEPHTPKRRLASRQPRPAMKRMMDMRACGCRS